MKPAVLILASSLALMNCAQNGQFPSYTAGGAMLGAAGGAGLGAAVSGKNRGLGALVGSLAGAALGGIIGAQLDAQSEARRQAALTQLARQANRPTRSAPSVSWSNPAENTHGTVQAKSPTTTVNGRRCILVQETITIRGQPKQAEAMRCQDANGAWT